MHKKTKHVILKKVQIERKVNIMANKKVITSALGRFSNSTSTDGDTSFRKDNVADYTVKKKAEGKYQLARILYLVVFFAVTIGVGIY